MFNRNYLDMKFEELFIKKFNLLSGFNDLFVFTPFQQQQQHSSEDLDARKMLRPNSLDSSQHLDFTHKEMNTSPRSFQDYDVSNFDQSANEEKGEEGEGGDDENEEDDDDDDDDFVDRDDLDQNDANNDSFSAESPEFHDEFEYEQEDHDNNLDDGLKIFYKSFKISIKI